MTHYNIPIKRRSPYKNTDVAVAHHTLVNDLQGFRKSAEVSAAGLRDLDTVNIDTSTSVYDKDLAFGYGKVLVLKQHEDGSKSELSLEFDTLSHETEKYSAKTGNASFTQVGSTMKLESNKNDSNKTTYFQFNDEAGYVTISDPNNDIPAIFEGVDPKDLIGNAPQDTEGFIAF